ncbi:MAG: hypothetical protein IKP50_00070 [Bacilli bacterium]|nr:hypothetical protein [Bacilli bacterium]
MLKENEQLGLLDIISIMSFIIALMNLDENLTQNDKQELIEELSNKTNLMLTEIHTHLEVQDNKLDKIMEALNNAGILQKTDVGRT